MQRDKNVQLAARWITAVLLFGMACVAGADQMMMRAQPAPATAQPMVVVPAAISPVASPPGPPIVPAAISPVASPPGPPNVPLPQKTVVPPPSQGGGVTLQKTLTPPSQAGGMAYQSPAMACVQNNTPRITSINGTQSGIVFKPGDSLNIVGCGFGKGGKAFLGSSSVPLIIDGNGWNDTNIKARIDPALSHAADLVGVALSVQPNGAAPMQSKSVYGFRAIREDVLALSSFNTANAYSHVYGTPTITANGAGPIRVSRHLDHYSGYCPQVTDQASQMTDFFPFKATIAKGFEATAIYTNETDQNTWENQKEQMILVGGSGGATYEVNKGVRVFFQGHSTYTKKYLLSGGYSSCTSSYTVALKLTGPRGMPPTIDGVVIELK